MTLDEAINNTIEPMHKVFEEAINNATTVDELTEVADMLGVVDEDKEFGFSKIAMAAFKNPPHTEKHDEALRLLSSKKKGNLDELMKNRKAIQLLLEFIGEMHLWAFGWKWVAEQFITSEENTNRQWTSEEDEELIECVCEDMPEVFLAAKFKRTPGSIKTRVSTLVGRKRISQKVAGKFIGEINGEKSEAKLNGTVYKEA